MGVLRRWIEGDLVAITIFFHLFEEYFEIIDWGFKNWGLYFVFKEASIVKSQIPIKMSVMLPLSQAENQGS